MAGFARRAILASLSLLGLSLGTEAWAQTPKAKKASAEHKKPVDAFNHIEGEVTVLKLKSAGAVVKKGEWVVEFDSTDLRDALARQSLGVESVEAAYRTAKMSREVAEIGVKEFVDGISKEDVERADAAIAQATAERARAEDRVKTSKSAKDQLVLTEARIAEQKAIAKKAILIKYTEAKNLKELEIEVLKAKEVELKAEAVFQLEKSKEEKLRREIEACKVVAPIDGTVGYLRPVEEEDTFREGEVVFRIFPHPAPKPDSKPN
jgi:multidrug efflux pump subunit AcrA (membrane-fusion protein)